MRLAEQKGVCLILFGGAEGCLDSFRMKKKDFEIKVEKVFFLIYIFHNVIFKRL